MMKLVLIICSTLTILNVNAQVRNIDQYIDSLMHKDYLIYLETSKETRSLEVLTESQWRTHAEKFYVTELLFPEAPGSYLIKAKNQILIGTSLMMFSGVIIWGGAFSENEIAQSAYAIGGIGLFISGVIFELIGIHNIGKAGVSLNNNGVGIKMSF